MTTEPCFTGVKSKHSGASSDSLEQCDGGVNLTTLKVEKLPNMVVDLGFFYYKMHHLV